MRLHLIPCLCAVLALAACERARPAGDVLAGNKDDAVYATTECVVGNPDGVRCDKKTCKKDAESDCAYFAERCLATDNHYAGTKDGGTCTRPL